MNGLLEIWNHSYLTQGQEDLCTCVPLSSVRWCATATNDGTNSSRSAVGDSNWSPKHSLYFHIPFICPSFLLSVSFSHCNFTERLIALGAASTTIANTYWYTLMNACEGAGDWCTIGSTIDARPVKKVSKPRKILVSIYHRELSLIIARWYVDCSV